MILFVGFGSATMTLRAHADGADFNGDGFDDLVIAAPAEDFDEDHPETGIVHVLYGSANGIKTGGDQVWALTTFQGGNAGSNHRCGSALAVGDFNGDGFSDLAMGMPGASVGGFEQAGAAMTLYGSPDGLTGNGAELFHRNNLDGDPHMRALFGRALAAGDFDGDGHDDLAVGVPGQTVNGLAGAGEVHVIYGSANGLDFTRQEIWNQDSPPDMPDLSEAFDSYGAALAVGDFNGNGRDDLAIGIPGEDFGGAEDCGAVQVLNGSASGLRIVHTQLYFQGVGDLGGVAEDFETFGNALATGDFDDDGNSDLAIGVPIETVANDQVAGAIHIIYGSNRGLTANGDRIFSQKTSGMLGEPEMFDFFGQALAAADFDGDDRDDLAIGVVGDLVGDQQAGSAQVMYGGNHGLRPAGNQLWNQDSPGITDRALSEELFGLAVTGGDYNGDGFADLAIGAPGEMVAGHIVAGVVHVLYGGPNGLRAKGDQLWHQNVQGIKGRSGRRRVLRPCRAMTD